VIPSVVLHDGHARRMFPPIPLPMIPAEKAQRRDSMTSMMMDTSGLSALQQNVIPSAKTLRSETADTPATDRNCHGIA